MSSNNTSETVFMGSDSLQPGADIYTDSTVWQPGTPAETETVLLPKGTVINGYMIMDTLSTKGKESVVYIAAKAAEEFALKLYKREVELVEAKMQALKQISCPYVAQLCDYGVYQGQHYEVYPYYKNGTIENKGRVEGEQLKRYIYQLNEALHSLHTAQAVSGMVHGDLKPSNIFLSDDEKSVILGDFGVSNIKTGENSHFARICGTPEYAPPSTGLMDQMKKSPAFDYGALGLVVYYLATGYSYFVGCTAEQIAQTWEKGITLPEEMDTRIKMLLNGLLQFDEQRRFGYEQVYDWYQGSFVHAVQPKKLYAETQNAVKASLWFGLFDGQVINVTSVAELVLQMRKHWTQAGVKLQDHNFYRFIDAFYPDGSVSEKIRGFLSNSDLDAAIFKTIYTLSDNAELVYKGKNFGDVPRMVAALSKQDPDAQELISKGLFLFYLDAMGYPADTRQGIQNVLALKNCSDAYRIHIINYMFASDKAYNGMASIDALRTAVCKMTLDEIDELVKKEDFLAWLYVMGLPDLSVSMATIRGAGV